MQGAGPVIADRRWTILVLAFAARAATGFQFQSVASTAQMLAEHYRVGFSDIGFLLGIYLLPGVFVAYAAGVLNQRYREDQLSIAALALMIVSAIGVGLSDSYLTGLLFRAVGGIGATIVIITVTKMIANWFNDREIVLAMSVVQMSWPVGAMIGLPVQAYLADSFGLATAILSTGVLTAIALAAFALFYSSPPRSETLQPASASLSRLSLASIMVAGLIWGAMNVACVLVFTSAPMVLQSQGLSPTLAASTVSAVVLLTIVSIPAGGYLIQLTGRTMTSIVLCASIAGGSLALFAVDIWPMASCVLFGLAVGPLSGAILSLPSLVLTPQERATGFGLFYSFFYVLMAAGPAFAGHLQDIWQTPVAPILFSSALLAMITPMLLIFVSLKRRYDTDHLASAAYPASA